MFWFLLGEEREIEVFIIHWREIPLLERTLYPRFSQLCESVWDSCIDNLANILKRLDPWFDQFGKWFGFCDKISSHNLPCGGFWYLCPQIGWWIETDPSLGQFGKCGCCICFTLFMQWLCGIFVLTIWHPQMKRSFI